MKPDTSSAMRRLIDQVRTEIPFDLPEETICSGDCRGCAKKLLEFLDAELSDWECRLDAGEVPLLGEVQRLGRCCRKVHIALRVSLAPVAVI